MPMEFGLELMSIISSDLPYAEWEFVDDVIDEIDGIGLCMFYIDFECADTSGIIDGRILEAAYLLALLPDESQKFNIHLNVMARNLFVVTLGVDLAKARSARQAVHAVALEDAIYCGIGYFDVVIAR